jgi:hypothetical protein
MEPEETMVFTRPVMTSTTWGSNWVPEQRLISFRAASMVRASR